MTDPLRVGIGVLGAAGIARKNCRGISKSKNAVVVAVGSRTLAKSEAFISSVEGCEGAHAYGSYEEVLADPRVDAVYIPLPSSLHLQWVTKAAEKGLHILCEKPIATTQEDLEGILDVCAKHGVQFMDGTMWSHNPRVRMMESALKEIGPVRAVHSIFTFLGNEDFMQNDVRVKKDLDGLGCLGDLGWYSVRYALWAYGFEKPIEVAAHSGPVFNSNGVLMHVGATIFWSDGRRADINCGFDLPLVQDVQVFGTVGTLRLEDMCIPSVENTCSFVATKYHGFTDVDTRLTTNKEVNTLYLEVPQETLMWERFSQVVLDIKAGKKPDPFWPNLSKLGQEVLFAIAESAENGCKLVKLAP